MFAVTGWEFGNQGEVGSDTDWSHRDRDKDSGSRVEAAVIFFDGMKCIRCFQPMTSRPGLHEVSCEYLHCKSCCDCKEELYEIPVHQGPHTAYGIVVSTKELCKICQAAEVEP